MNQATHFKKLAIVMVTWALDLIASGYSPADRITWGLEVFPASIAFAFMWPTRKSLPLTPMLDTLIAIHGLILILGGAYTYAKLPLGFWMQDWFGFTRNNYDKIGHFAQGFVPAIATRELLVRKFNVRHRRLLPFFFISICLGFSALYEIIEWRSAVAMGQGADNFLGTQGDIWDT